MPDDTAPVLSLLTALQSTVEASRTETAGAINGLRTELSGRMDQMITRREHEAEVRRQDAETSHVRRALAEHETHATRRLDEITEQQEGIARQIREGEERRTAAKEQAEQQRRADRRSLILILTGAVSAASAVTGVIVSVIGG